jgi:predicted nucleotidyltransferase
MATINLPQDFKEFLQLLNDHEVKYLLVGGYAVGYHGFPRATVDMDIWVAINPQNAQKIVTVLEEFGFNFPELNVDLFLKQDKIIRMGIPPMRLEILTTVSGVEFEICYQNRIIAELDGVQIDMIGLDDLKRNKLAAGRHKDLNDLENLP